MPPLDFVCHDANAAERLYAHSLGWVCTRLCRFLPATLLGGMHDNGGPLCLP